MIRKKSKIFEKTTLYPLGVGPMSLNCVNATVELGNDYSIPLMIIASRRQIDSEDFNGGYVNNWTTSKFADHVRKKINWDIILIEIMVDSE